LHPARKEQCSANAGPCQPGCYSGSSRPVPVASKAYSTAMSCWTGCELRFLNSSSQQTPRWREMDSNPRSRFTYSPFRTPGELVGWVAEDGSDPAGVLI